MAALLKGGDQSSQAANDDFERGQGFVTQTSTASKLEFGIDRTSRNVYAIVPEEHASRCGRATFRHKEWVSIEGVSRESLSRLAQLTFDLLDEGFEYVVKDVLRIVSEREVLLPFDDINQAHAIYTALRHSGEQALGDLSKPR